MFRVFTVVVLTAAITLWATGCQPDPIDVNAPAVLTEDLRLDAERENFSIVGRMVIGPRGEIAVPQPQDYSIILFDSAGTRLGVAGRKGPGPGEFEHMSTLGWLADSLWVYDTQRRILTYFLRDASLVRAAPLPAALSLPSRFDTPGAIFFMGVSAITRTGQIVGEARLIERGASGRSAMRTTVIVRTDTGSQWHVIDKPPSFEDSRWSMEASGFGRSIPFAQRPLGTTAPDGSRHASLMADITSDAGGVYTVTVVASSGDTLLARSWPFVGVAVPQAAIDSAIAAEVTPSAVREGPSNLDQQFQKIARERIPRFYAPVQALMLGMDNTIWITLRDSAGVRTTLVLDEHGEQIGKVVLTDRLRIRQASRTQIWATELNDDDLASVVRYKVSGICAVKGCLNR